MEGNSTPVKKILIIDDDNRNIFALKAVLKSKGYECLTATNGEEGLLHLAKPDSVAVVLLDMMMPEMDGYEMLQRIRGEMNISLPVISVTAHAMHGDKEKCLSAGADAYLPKPVDVDQLIQLLNHYLN